MQRVTRHIFHSRGTIEPPSLVLRPGELRRTALSVPLPRILPPTFSGTSLRFSYHVHVSWTADFQATEAVPVSALQSAGTNAPVDTNAVELRDVLSAPSEPSASQPQSCQSSPTKSAADHHQSTAAATAASTVISAAEVAAAAQLGKHDRGDAAVNGNAASANGASAHRAGTNGQVCRSHVPPTPYRV